MPKEQEQEVQTNVHLRDKGEDWIKPISDHLGFEPTFSVTKEEDPRTLEQIAVFHIRRKGIPEEDVLCDANAIAITCLKDRLDMDYGIYPKPDNIFRIDIRADIGDQMPEFYDPSVFDIILNAEGESIDLYHEGDLSPSIRIFKAGYTTPNLEVLDAQTRYKLGLNQAQP